MPTVCVVPGCSTELFLISPTAPWVFSERGVVFFETVIGLLGFKGVL